MATAVAILQALAATAESKLTFKFFKHEKQKNEPEQENLNQGNGTFYFKIFETEHPALVLLILSLVLMRLIG